MTGPTGWRRTSVLGALLLLLGFPVRAEDGKGSVPGVREPAPTEPTWGHPLDVIALHYPQVAPLPREEGALLRATKALADANGKVQTIVALVPDPIDSRTPGSFDQALLAIQKGAAANAWLLDRYYLPWSDTKRLENREKAAVINVQGPPAPAKGKGRLGYFEIPIEPEKAAASVVAASSAASKGVKGAPLAESLVRSHELRPGVITFRRGRDLLAVFLVGETQTWGVQRAPFRRAVLWAHELTKPARRDVLILGPWFSGTGSSLEQEIAMLREEIPAIEKVDIRSGSASAKGLFQPLPEGVAFRTYLRTDDDTLDVAMAFFRATSPRRGPEPHLALVFEKDTLYGQKAGGDEARTGTLKQSFFLLPVYGRLSGVRSEWTEGPAQSGGAPAAFRDIRRLSRLSLEDRGTPSDVLPQVASISNAAIGVALESLVDQLRRARVTRVGIVMTDVRDRIYLAQVLHRQLPDLTFFFLDGHSVYLHPDLDHVLSGSLVFSSYTLEPEIGGQWEQFTSDSEAGTFHALRSMLGSGNPRSETLVSVIHGGHFVQLEESRTSRGRYQPRPRREDALRRILLGGLGVAVVVLALLLLAWLGLAISRGHASRRLVIVKWSGNSSFVWRPAFERGALPEGPVILALLGCLLWLAWSGLAMTVSPAVVKGGLVLGDLAPAFSLAGVLLTMSLLTCGSNRLHVFHSSIPRVTSKELLGLLALTLGVGGALAYVFARRRLEPVFEGTVPGAVLASVLVLAILRVTWTFGVFVLLWGRLSARLRRAEWWGLGEGDFERLRERVGWSPMDALGGRRPIASAISEAVSALERWSGSRPDLVALGPLLQACKRLLTTALGEESTTVLDSRRKLQNLLLDLSASAGTPPAHLTPGAPVDPLVAAVGLAGTESLASSPSYRELVACQTLIMARCVFEELRVRLLETVGLLLLAILWVSVYPFMPKHTVMLLLLAVVVATGVSVFLCLREMDRNPVLSWASGGKAWKVEWSSSFMSRLALYGLSPLIALVATEAPGLGEILAPLVDAVTRVLR